MELARLVKIFEGRPCDTCIAESTCENTDCKEFLKWVREGENIDKPEGINEKELIEKTGLSSRQVRKYRENGKLRYALWKNKCIYTHADEDIENLKVEIPKNLIRSDELKRITGATRNQILHMLQVGKIKAEAKIEGYNYFSLSTIAEVTRCVS